MSGEYRVELPTRALLEQSWRAFEEQWVLVEGTLGGRCLYSPGCGVESTEKNF